VTEKVEELIAHLQPVQPGHFHAFLTPLPDGVGGRIRRFLGKPAVDPMLLLSIYKGELPRRSTKTGKQCFQIQYIFYHIKIKKT
jgi:hypothetical protein